MTASLAPLTELEELALEGSTLHLLPAARLPTSLTQLSLSGTMDSKSLTKQVRLPVLHASMRACSSAI